MLKFTKDATQSNRFMYKPYVRMFILLKQTIILTLKYYAKQYHTINR